jgi:DNA polymerase
MWTERQAALLKAMGVRLWSAPLATADSVEGSALPVVDSAQSVARVVPGPSPSASSSASSTSSPRSSAQASQHPPAHPPPAAARGLPLHPALPAQVAALDWPALQAAVAGCRACALCDSRRQTVFGAGHTQARWLVACRTARATSIANTSVPACRTLCRTAQTPALWR